MTEEHETRVRHAAVAIKEAKMHVTEVSTRVGDDGGPLPQVTFTLTGDTETLETFALALSSGGLTEMPSAIP